MVGETSEIVGRLSLIYNNAQCSTSYFENLKYWRRSVSLPEDQGYVVYGGDQSIQTSAGALVSWRQLERILY